MEDKKVNTKADVDEQYDENPDSETLDFTVEGNDDVLSVGNIFTLNADTEDKKSRIELINDLRYAASHRMIFSVLLIGADYKRINDKQVLCLIGKLDPPFDVFDIYKNIKLKNLSKIAQKQKKIQPLIQQIRNLKKSINR